MQSSAPAAPDAPGDASATVQQQQSSFSHVCENSPYGVGRVVVVTASPVVAGDAAHPDGLGGDPPPWLLLLSQQRPVEEVIAPGEDPCWQGALERRDEDVELERNRRRRLCLSLTVRASVALVFAVCLALGITGTIVRSVSGLQMFYFGAIIFLILSSCGFAALFACLCEGRLAPRPPAQEQVWTPVVAASSLGHYDERAMAYLRSATSTCYRCLVLLEAGAASRVRLASATHGVKSVILCSQCLVCYLTDPAPRGAGVESTVAPCPICLEEVENLAPMELCGNAHVFHLKCLNEWRRAAVGTVTCPVCRIRI